jgi:hypothetical protein
VREIKLKKIFIKPSSSSLVRFPNQPERILNESGEEVLESPYWQRRLRGKDVVLATTEKKKSSNTGGK